MNQFGCQSFKAIPRRDFIRIGGASLCSIGAIDLLRAAASAAAVATADSDGVVRVERDGEMRALG